MLRRVASPTPALAVWLGPIRGRPLGIMEGSNAPDVPYQIQKAAGNAAYWYTDGDAQYNG